MTYINVNCSYCKNLYSCLLKQYNRNIKRGSKNFCSIQCQGTHKRNRVSTICSTCGNIFNKLPSQKKKSKSGRDFCSKSCAAVFNNFKFPKKLLKSNNKIGDAKGRRASNLRYQSRIIYMKSDKPKHCVVCGYSNHFQVCHIVPVSQFSDDDTWGAANNIDNLIALCPNHHWEFDNGMISLTELKLFMPRTHNN